MAFDVAKIPENLKQAYAKGRVAVMVGAGASMNSGLPNWSQFLVAMIDHGEANNFFPAVKAAQYRALVGNVGKYLMLASSLKEDFGNSFDEFIEKVFIDPKPKPSLVHDALVGMKNLQFVLTTNYDTLLERSFRNQDPDISVCTFRDSGEIQRRLAKREFFILKAHGDAAKPGNGVVLTDADYRNLIFSQRAYQSLLTSMFMMYSIVFVGASLADPEIKLLLSFIRDSFSAGSGPTHYALMAQEDITDIESARWFKDFNVSFIPISKADKYAELPELLTALHNSV